MENDNAMATTQKNNPKEQPKRTTQKNNTITTGV
jgi:hypothetical protein